MTDTARGLLRAREALWAGVPAAEAPAQGLDSPRCPAVPQCRAELTRTRALEPTPLGPCVCACLRPQLRTLWLPLAPQEGGLAAPSLSAATGLRQGPWAPRLPSARECRPHPGQGVLWGRGRWGSGDRRQGVVAGRKGWVWGLAAPPGLGSQTGIWGLQVSRLREGSPGPLLPPPGE